MSGIVSKGICKACGAEIVWIRMRSGRMMPCDALQVLYTPDPKNGRLTLISEEGRIVKGNPAPVPIEPGIQCCIGYGSHYATCPAADRFRRKS